MPNRIAGITVEINGSRVEGNSMNEEQRNDQNSQEIVSARERRRQELESVFNPNNMKVVRKELFPSSRDPAVIFRNGMEVHEGRLKEAEW